MAETLRLITQTESWQAKSQQSTIELLQEWLDKAKAGEIVSVALAGEGPDGLNHNAFTRPVHRYTMIGTLDRMKYMLHRDIDQN